MTALRLPDQFSPDALDATAATPTCCCCCCCCLATTLTAPIVLHGALRREVRDSPAPEPRRKAAPWLAAAVWPALLVAVFGPFGVPADAELLLIIVCLIGASALTAAVAIRGGSTRPYRAVLRLVLFALLFSLEFMIGAMLLLFGVYVFAGPILAGIGVFFAIKAYR